LGRPGRPSVAPRLILDGILWKLATRSSWQSISFPGRAAFPKQGGGKVSHQLCYLYYRRWRDSGLLAKIINALIKDLHLRGKFDPKQAFEKGQVWFEPIGNQYVCFVQGEIAVIWQIKVAMLTYQRLAAIMERNQGLARVPDPLLEVFDAPARRHHK
jgi:transposase